MATAAVVLCYLVNRRGEEEAYYSPVIEEDYKTVLKNDRENQLIGQGIFVLIGIQNLSKN